MNILKLTDQKLADLRQSLSNEARRRAQVAVNGQDAATVIWGNEMAKRAVTVAAAGKHSILFVGPANSGKTMLRAMCLELGVDESYESRHCPCGNHGELSVACRCTLSQIRKVVARFPVVDITVEVCRPKERDIGCLGMTTSDIQDAIARMSQHAGERLESDPAALLKAATREFGLDLATIARIRQVARTIANLDHAQFIGPQHIVEAVNYRTFTK